MMKIKFLLDLKILHITKTIQINILNLFFDQNITLDPRSVGNTKIGTIPTPVMKGIWAL